MTASPPARGYLLKGDPVLVADRLKSLLAELKAAGLEIEEAAGDLDGASIAQACNAFFLGGEDKAVIVRDAGRLVAKDDVAAIAAYLKDPNPQTSLVFVDGQPPIDGRRQKPIIDGVKAVGAVLDCAVPAGKGKGMWLDERLAASSLRLERAAVNRLADHLGEDIGRLPGILAVLEAHHGVGAKIGVGDLHPVLGDVGAGTPWDLTDAIERGDVAGAIGHLRRALAGRPAFVVNIGLWNHYQRLLRLDGSGARTETEAAALLGMKGSTFPAKKALASARLLGTAGVVRAVELLAQADLDLRGVKDWPDDMVLEVLVARLARLSAPPKRR